MGFFWFFFTASSDDNYKLALVMAIDNFLSVGDAYFSKKLIEISDCYLEIVKIVMFLSYE